jgi:hypothetical protein
MYASGSEMEKFTDEKYMRTLNTARNDGSAFLYKRTIIYWTVLRM